MKNQGTDEATMERLKASFYSLAIGDAIGFITEVTGFSNMDLRDWKYEKGTFSDDTQLTLITAESLDDVGRFDPERFVSLITRMYRRGEIRGIGLSTRLAVESLMDGKRWYENFYEGRINYVETGANGCAMRILPIGLINDCFDETGKLRLVEDTLKNSIITHGHPRAHISAILISLCYSYVFRNGNLGELVDFILDELPDFQRIEKILPEHWLERWNELAFDKTREYTYMKGGERYGILYEKTSREVKDLIREMWDEFMNLDQNKIFRKTNATQLKGSGTATVLSAIFVFLRYPDDFEKSVISCASNSSIDSDTVASMVGALYGLENGLTEDIDHYLREMREIEKLDLAISKISSILWKE